MDNSGFASVKKWLVNNFHPPIEHQPAGDESSRVGFTSAEHSCVVCLPSFLQSLRLVPVFCFVIFFIYCLLLVSLFICYCLMRLFGGASRPQLRWSTTASWVGDSVIAARSTLSKKTRALNMLKGTDKDSTQARLHSSSVSSDRDQPSAAWPRRRIWALLSNIRMTVGTVAPQALVIGR